MDNFEFINDTYGYNVGEGVPLGVEPILFGVFATAWDTLLIKFRHMARQMLADARGE